VVAAETNSAALQIMEQVRRDRIQLFLGRNRPVPFTEAEIDMLLESSHGDSIMSMLKYTAVGDGAAVAQYLQEFAAMAQADELITVHNSSDSLQRLASVKITAQAMNLAV
jgi:alkanesulfonate monooxygenase SsuD/methylene tetrahydromethanopterin reductase-like flavin-dependent oxidoreductase (luciferase family)